MVLCDDTRPAGDLPPLLIKYSVHRQAKALQVSAHTLDHRRRPTQITHRTARVNVTPQSLLGYFST